jgi:hypothetical protein
MGNGSYHLIHKSSLLDFVGNFVFCHFNVDNPYTCDPLHKSTFNCLLVPLYQGFNLLWPTLSWLKGGWEISKENIFETFFPSSMLLSLPPDFLEKLIFLCLYQNNIFLIGLPPCTSNPI